MGWVTDGSVGFARAVGLEPDLTARGVGVRSPRYAAIVDSSTVTTLAVQEQPGTLDVRSADAMMARL